MKTKLTFMICAALSLDIFGQGLSYVGPQTLKAFTMMKEKAAGHSYISSFSWQESSGVCEQGRSVAGKKLVKTVSYLAGFLYGSVLPGDIENGLLELLSRVEFMQFEVTSSDYCDGNWCSKTFTFCNSDEGLSLSWNERN